MAYTSRNIFLFLSIYFARGSYSQTLLSGVINSYTAVDSLYVSGNESTLAVNSIYGFAANDKVLIIQMTGAVADTSNTANFGSVISIADAGNYEFSRIASISGNKISLCSKLVRNYNTVYPVQLVSVPEYTNAIVTDTLFSQSWNGSTGGILCLDVSQDLIFLADIDVSAKGFPGGQSNYYGGVNCGQTDYYYSDQSTNGVDKGKGIYAYSYAKSRGRGAAANAGGGGNNHNAGGGGGGNYGGGGHGGYEWTNCTGTLSNGGRGAYPLPYSNADNKIFMGGGGGAGHNNSTNANTPGGSGGGIVIIKAGSISSNNHSIKANAENAPSPILFYDEGRGGGGGGGTILIESKIFADTLRLEVKGGTGGNSNTCCAGTGGGGGGGVTWLSTATVPSNCTINFSGGSTGIANTGGPLGSQDGEPGAVLTSLNIPAFSCSPALSQANAGQEKANTIFLYPNPCGGIFTIHLSKKNASAKICVYDALGNCVLTKIASNETENIDLSGKARGIYFVEVKTAGERITKKLMVN